MRVRRVLRANRARRVRRRAAARGAPRPGCEAAQAIERDLLLALDSAVRRDELAAYALSGILIILLMETAMITPPVGINLYVVQGLRKRGRIDDVIIGTLPFVFTLMAMMAIIAVWPGLVLWLPRLATG